MNRSNQRLKTIESQQIHKPIHTQIIPIQHHQSKKQSTRKISLKQSVLKQQRDITVPQIYPKSKKSAQINLENDHRYKIVKQLQTLTKPQQSHKKSHKFNNLNKNNKSLIFSDHKLTNQHQNSTLKASKVIGTDSKSGTTNKQKQQYSYKKGSQKGSTTKKHSKSVYNYTQFDEYPQTKTSGSKKHVYTKQSQGNRQYHNRSSMTQQGHHQISTSSITKRVTKSRQILKKLLNNSQIKKKTSNFKILSGCLRTYIKQEQQSENKIDSSQIIKLIKAFNKSQISKMSKPLQQLISQMIQLIQQTVDKQKQQILTQQKQQVKYKSRSKQKSKQFNKSQLINKYQTPQRFISKSINQSLSKNKHNQFIVQQNQSPNDISKTKKIYPDSYQYHNHDSIAQQDYHSSLSKDLNQMEQGLQQLKSESKQLKKFIQQSSHKKHKHQSHQKQHIQSQSDNKRDQSKQYQNTSQFLQQNQQKRIQIHKLKQILQKQKLILQKINHFSSHSQSQSQRQKSSNQSSLKCYPPQQQ